MDQETLVVATRVLAALLVGGVIGLEGCVAKFGGEGE
jgi:hypothetical protein